MTKYTLSKQSYYVIIGSNKEHHIMGFGTYHRGFSFADREVAERAMEKLTETYPTTNFFILPLVPLDSHL